MAVPERLANEGPLPANDVVAAAPPAPEPPNRDCGVCLEDMGVNAFQPDAAPPAPQFIGGRDAATYTLACGHTFHTRCLLTAVWRCGNNCPTCRAPVVVLPDAVHAPVATTPTRPTEARGRERPSEDVRPTIQPPWQQSDPRFTIGTDGGGVWYNATIRDTSERTLRTNVAALQVGMGMLLTSLMWATCKHAWNNRVSPPLSAATTHASGAENDDDDEQKQGAFSDSMLYRGLVMLFLVASVVLCVVATNDTAPWRRLLESNGILCGCLVSLVMAWVCDGVPSYYDTASATPDAASSRRVACA